MDTQFVIELLRGKKEISELREKYSDYEFAISSISIAELYTGLRYTHLKLGNSIYEKALTLFNKTINNFKILEVNNAIMKIAGNMSGQLMFEGKTVDMIDLIIGATAKYYYSDIIITSNKKHFNCWNIEIANF